MNSIKRACEVLGGQRKLAEVLGVTTSAVNQWATQARPVPADRCPTIERATSGAVRCEDLRPDVDWAYLRATDCPVTPEPEKKAA
jgi:DNA-binding transcriptional regulator YdaS (Cro superfamily)